MEEHGLVVDEVSNLGKRHAERIVATHQVGDGDFLFAVVRLQIRNRVWKEGSGPGEAIELADLLREVSIAAVVAANALFRHFDHKVTDVFLVNLTADAEAAVLVLFAKMNFALLIFATPQSGGKQFPVRSDVTHKASPYRQG